MATITKPVSPTRSPSRKAHQQAHAYQGDENGRQWHGRKSFPKEKKHQSRDEQRIEEVDGGGYTAGHIAIAVKEEKCRAGIQEAQQYQRPYIRTADFEAAAREAMQYTDGDGCEEKAIEENKLERSTLSRNRQREQGDEPECGGRQYTDRKTVEA